MVMTMLTRTRTKVSSSTPFQREAPASQRTNATTSWRNFIEVRKFPMKKNVLFLTTVALMLMASPVFAQGGAEAGVGGSVTALGAALGMALASGLCGLAQGKAVATSTEAVARNPGAAATIQTLMILGLAFIESLALFTLVIIFLKA